MKIKKALSIILTAAMLTASVTSVQADDIAVKGSYHAYPENWRMDLHYDDTIDKNSHYIGVTEAGYEGKGLEFCEGDYDSYRAVYAGLNENITVGNEYTLSYWFKGTGQNMQVMLDTGWNNRYQAPDEYKDGNWHFVEHTFTATTDMSEVAMIAEYALLCVIDNFSIKNSSGKEIVMNGDFEKVIYTDRVGHTDNYTLNSWYMTDLSSEMDINGHYARVTDKYEHSNGGHSLHIKYTEVQTPNHYFRLQNNVETSFEAGQEYCIEVYIKDGVNNPGCLRLGTIWCADWMGSVDYQLAQMTKGETDENGWTRYYKTFTAGSNANGRVQFLAEATNDLILDDITIYKTSDATKTNLVADGGFEDVHPTNFSAENSEKLIGTNVFYSQVPSEYTENYYAEPSKRVANSGEYSMHIRYPHDSVPNRYIQVRQDLLSPCEAGEYTITFYTYGNYNSFNAGIAWGWLEGYVPVVGDYMSHEKQSNGWVKHTATRTVDGVDDNYMNIVIDGKNDLYIDDFSIVKVGSDVNLVPDGGFENIFKTNPVAEGIYMPTVSLIDIPNVPDEYKENYYAEPSTNAVHSGKYSMHIRYPHDVVPGRYVQVRQNLPVACEAGEYTVTFYTFGEYSYFNAGIAWAEGYGNSDTYTKERQADGWVKHTRTFTVDGSGDDYMNFIVDAKNEIYLDDFSIVKVGSDVNLVPDSGFEGVAACDYHVSRVAAISAGSGAVNLFWTNPYGVNVDNIEVLVDGNLLPGSYNLTPEARNCAAITGLENYVVTPVEIVVTYKNKKYTTSVEVTADDFGAEYTLGDWRINRFPEINTSFNIDKNVYSEGTSSMRIDSNHNAWKDNYYPFVSQKVTGLDPTSTYVLKFMAKADNIGNFKFIDGNPWIQELFIQDYGATKGEKTHDWKEYTYVIRQKPEITTETYDTELYFAVETGLGSLWLDDIRLYKGVILPNGMQEIDYSTNYIKNGGFEYEDYAIQEPVFSKGGSTINALESGLIETKVRMKNYTMGDSFKPALVVALYNGTKLVDVSFTEQSISQNIYDGALPDELAVTINVPEMTSETDYNLKIMYWDGINSLKALDSADVFK